MLKSVFFLLLLFFLKLSAEGQIRLDSDTRLIFDLGQTNNKESLKDLITNCDGFKFSIVKNASTGNPEIRYKNQNVALQAAIKGWSELLKSASDRTFTLFIDTDISWDRIRVSLEECGLMKLVALKNSDGSLPLHSKSLKEKKQLIIFSLSEQDSTRNWVFPYWKHGFQLKPSINVPTLFNDLEKGNSKSDLLLIEIFSSSELFKDFQKKYASSGWSLWQFYLNYLINIWQQNGKKVSYFVTDPASGLNRKTVEGLNYSKSISGKVQHNLLALDYVIWAEGENQKGTTGEFNFPVFPNREITLAPSSPGFEFSPASIKINYTNIPDSIYFFANPVNIKKHLQVYLPLKKNSLDFNGGDDGINHGVVFRSDSQRGSVAAFGPKRWVGLPPANKLGIVQSDFTFSVWLKLDSVNSEQSVIGTYTNDLRGSIHLSLRDSIPYFGFFGNDHLGKMRLQTGRWYHVVWRYMKFSGEQAIYVDGKLDSRSNNHPAYDGTDSLYIGRTTLVGGRYFNGQMSDFVLWNRALSDTEIQLLAKDLAAIDSSFPVHYWYWVAAFLILLLAIASVFLFRKKANRTPIVESATKIHIDVPVIGTSTEQNVTIQLFGKFNLTDTEGVNHVSDLSPKIRELMLVLLLYSHKFSEGLSTEELTILLWSGFDSKKATNNRNVSVHKLRLILKELPGLELSFRNNFWKLNLDSQVDFDYKSCFLYLKQLDNPANHSSENLSNFYLLVSKGRFLPEDQYPWLDIYKERIDNEIVALLTFIIEKNQQNFSKEELINWVDLLMLFDPINEEMLQMLMKTLTDSKLAKHYYSKFSQEYKLHFGEKFNVTFDELFVNG